MYYEGRRTLTAYYEGKRRSLSVYFITRVGRPQPWAGEGEGEKAAGRSFISVEGREESFPFQSIHTTP